jgi:hypothetical protein
MGVLKFLALICVIVLGWFVRTAYYRKPYDECSPNEKQIRRVGAVITGTCAVIIVIAVLWSLLRN